MGDFDYVRQMAFEPARKQQHVFVREHFQWRRDVETTKRRPEASYSLAWCEAVKGIGLVIHLSSCNIPGEIVTMIVGSTWPTPYLVAALFHLARLCSAGWARGVDDFQALMGSHDLVVTSCMFPIRCDRHASEDSL